MRNFGSMSFDEFDKRYEEPDLWSDSESEDYNPLPPPDETKSGPTEWDKYLPEIEQRSYASGPNSGYSKRGYFVIFNQESFYKKSGQILKRKGTDRDAAKIKKVMTALGFTVRVYKDYSRSEILDTLEKYRGADFSDCEMFGMAMLSHGLSDGRILTGRSQIQVNNLVDPIKMNETLHGKPKLFFIQACRGHGMHDGWQIRSTYEEQFGDESDYDNESLDGGSISNQHSDYRATQVSQRWATDADILVHFAQSEGFTSNRNPYWGSVFVLALCYFMKYAYQYELHDLLIRVNALVCLRETHTNNPKTDSKKQIPQIQSQLTKLLYLKPKPGLPLQSEVEKLEFEYCNVVVENGIANWDLGIPEQLLKKHFFNEK